MKSEKGSTGYNITLNTAVVEEVEVNLSSEQTIYKLADIESVTQLYEALSSFFQTDLAKRIKD